MLTPAKTWEANGDYSRAIEAYLKMTVMQTTDYALLEEVNKHFIHRLTSL